MKNLLLGLSITLLFSNSVALAAEGEKSSGGLPQLDPTTFSSQIFWLFVFFILLYLILSSVALPKIATVIERRRLKISNDLEDAKTLKEDALELKDAYEKSLAVAHKDTSELMNKIHETVSKSKFDAHQALTKELFELQAATEASIENGKAKAMKDLRESATSIALELANKLGDIAVNDNDAVEAVIAAQRKLDDAA